ncbi:MAG: hypothetical protein QOH88_2371 [Verrucomicrobiota bacterium]
MDCVDLRPRLRAATHIRLICDHHEKEAILFKAPASLRSFFIQLKFFDGGWRIRATIAHHATVQHTVPIQENRASLYLVLSHFVCAILSFG